MEIYVVGVWSCVLFFAGTVVGISLCSITLVGLDVLLVVAALIGLLSGLLAFRRLLSLVRVVKNVEEK